MWGSGDVFGWKGKLKITEELKMWLGLHYSKEERLLSQHRKKENNEESD